MEAFSRGIFSSSHRIQWSQKHCLLSECSCVKSTSSSVGPIPHSFRLQNYISSGETTREGRCIITALVSTTASWRANFRYQQQVILGPARHQATQVFGMPFDSHVIDTIHEDLKTDAFAEAILAQIDPSRGSCSQSQQPGMFLMVLVDNSNVMMDYYSLRKSCMFLMVLVAFE